MMAKKCVEWQKYVWYLVNKHRKKASKVHPIRSEDGNILTDADAIRKDWTNYYKRLYTDVDDDPAYDDEFKRRVESELDISYDRCKR